MRYALGFLLACSIPFGRATAQDERKWLCIADSVVGFVYREGSWTDSRFNPSHGRFIVSKVKSVKTGKLVYGTTDIGSELPAECFSESVANNSLTCFSDWGGYFSSLLLLNFKTGRFVKTSTGTYTMGVESEKNDTPYLMIGKCSPL